MLKLKTSYKIKTVSSGSVTVVFHDGEGEIETNTGLARKVGSSLNHNTQPGEHLKLYVERKDDGPLYGEVMSREQYLWDDETETKYKVREEIKV